MGSFSDSDLEDDYCGVGPFVSPPSKHQMGSRPFEYVQTSMLIVVGHYRAQQCSKQHYQIKTEHDRASETTIIGGGRVMPGNWMP